jgi:hypothetical protein
LIYHQPTGTGVKEWTPPSARERAVGINVRPQFSAELLLKPNEPASVANASCTLSTEKTKPISQFAVDSGRPTYIGRAAQGSYSVVHARPSRPSLRRSVSFMDSPNAAALDSTRSVLPLE